MLFYNWTEQGEKSDYANKSWRVITFLESWCSLQYSGRDYVTNRSKKDNTLPLMKDDTSYFGPKWTTIILLYRQIMPHWRTYPSLLVSHNTSLLWRKRLPALWEKNDFPIFQVQWCHKFYVNKCHLSLRVCLWERSKLAFVNSESLKVHISMLICNIWSRSMEKQWRCNFDTEVNIYCKRRNC